MAPVQQSGANGDKRREDARLAYARRRVEAIKGFYVHLFVFALVVLGLAVLNFAAGGPWWVLWVFGGWGIGVLAHAFAVFGRAPKAIAAWEERKIRQMMDER
jgi:fatty acid desaturase